MNRILFSPLGLKVTSRVLDVLNVLALMVLGAVLSQPARAQCTHPLSPTSWVETCDMATFTGPNSPKLRINLSTHVDRDYFALNRSLLFPGFVTNSLNRVRFEFVAVQGASEFAIDTALFPVRATTHFLLPLQSVSVHTPQDVAAMLEAFPPPGLDVHQPWALRTTVIGGALLQHVGQCTSSIDFYADATVTVDYVL